MVKKITFFYLPTCGQCKGPLSTLQKSSLNGYLNVLDPTASESDAALFDFNSFHTIPALIVKMNDNSIKRAQGIEPVMELISELSNLIDK